MGFSLSYAFGKTGRHIRTIATAARQFIKSQYDSLPNNPVADFLYKQSLAIDCTLFGVFYSEPESRLYVMHRKYLPVLLKVTESGYRRLMQAYASALVVGLPLGSGTEEELNMRLATLYTLSHLYDGREPEHHWFNLAYRPDNEETSIRLIGDIAKVLRVEPRDDSNFIDDWLSLVPSMHTATKIVQQHYRS